MGKVVAKDMVVTLAYQVSDADGELVDAGNEPLTYLHGGYEDLFPKLEAALDGKAVGETVTVRLEPAESFGEYDADLVQMEDVASFPPGIEVGMQFEGAPADGDDEDESQLFTVTHIEDGKAILDGNHPLAGMVLVFTCTVSTIRPATAAEIAEECPAD
ncbi:Peptidyl-prolyl cis-trans isomerase [Candidatus Terasakiella magnetica]|nr:Peptidyl-prolyl cis-trans isomerase [Candidatus Terasakiella magnetica]